VVVIGEVAAAAPRLVEQLGDLDVDAVMVVSATEGVGPLPDRATLHFTRTAGETLMGGLRAYSASLDNPDAALTAALDAFDPDGTAWVLAPPFGLDAPLAGRRTYGARRPEWIELENKMTVDSLWDRAGLDRAPSRVVDVGDAAAAHRDLAGDHGTVWVADNSEGWHGGGEYVRWVRDDAAVPVATEWFAAHAERVRVMPFLDGIPCSIHGYVTAAGVAAFRPVEMLIARASDPAGFSYMGFATTWDPPGWVRDQMRAAARAVASTLDQSVGYRGPFSIDGVATAGGFRPTELNPRFSPGFGIQAAKVEGLAIGLLTRALIEGDLPVDPVWLEEAIVSAADTHRVAGMGLVTKESVEPGSIHIRVDGDRLVGVEEPAQGTIGTGAAISGSFVRMTLDEGAIPIGASMAPYAVQGARLAADHWGFDLPVVQPAPDVLSLSRDG
jgi:hypothetical protein